MSKDSLGLLTRAYLFLSAVWIALPILVAQNLLGMHLNLWLDFSHYSSTLKAFSSFPTLDIHVAVGILILSIASFRVWWSYWPENRPFRPASILILVFAIVAFLSGVMFTFYGHDDIYSFTMEFGFGGLIFSAAILIYTSFKLLAMKGQGPLAKH